MGIGHKGTLTSLAMILGAEEKMLGLAEKPEPNFHNKMSLQQKRKLVWQKSRGYSKTVTKVTTQIFLHHRESDYKGKFNGKQPPYLTRGRLVSEVALGSSLCTFLRPHSRTRDLPKCQMFITVVQAHA